MPKFEERYICDGVYASFDGYHIILELSVQDPKHRIALEPEVFNALLQYKSDINNILKEGLANFGR